MYYNFVVVVAAFYSILIIYMYVHCDRQFQFSPGRSLHLKEQHEYEKKKSNQMKK